MVEYSGMDYEVICDCFAKTRNVKSIFLYGDKTYIEDPFITVLIPTNRRVHLLEQAIKSVLSQWYTDFFWDIIVLDNEPYDGCANATERLIRKLDNSRILYYRNTANLKPGDNFNRGIFLSRGKWVMMLHDDDLLISNAVLRMGRLIEGYERILEKPIGAIAARRWQIVYDEKKDVIKSVDVEAVNRYLTHNIPINYDLHRITHNTIWFTSHAGGDVPSNGTAFCRSAFIDIGGFNEDFGISADLVLFYSMGNKYSVFATCMPFGFYRWGANTMSKTESTHKTILAGYDFREYIYSKNMINKLLGKLFRKIHYKKFTTDVITEKNSIGCKKLKLKDFDYIYDRYPSRIIYYFFSKIVLSAYMKYKRLETRFLSKKARRVMENE